MEKQILVQAFKMSFVCPHCKAGEMFCMEMDKLLLVSIGKPPPPQPNQKPIAHRCGKCSFVMGLPLAYPHIRHEPIETEGFQTEGEA